MKRSLFFFAVFFVVAEMAPGDEGKVRVLCGSSMTEPVKKVADAFERDMGIGVELTLGGCESLFPQVELGAPADVFVGHAPFAERLDEKGVRTPRLVVLGRLRPTLVVAKGNPKGVSRLADLGREGMRVGLPDSRYSTCGEMFEQGALGAGMLDAIEQQTVYMSRAHQELATALITGNLDAVIVWNFIAAMHRDRFDEVPMEIDFPSAPVFVTRLKKAQNAEGAEKFLDYFERVESRAVFQEMGYGTVESAVVAGNLMVYCTAGMQKPIDELAEIFKGRHPGVDFQMTYQGSGALLAQIELTKVGDLYVAGDDFFMKTALDKKLVSEAKRVAVFTPVLATPKGNPAGLGGFADLTRAGIRLGMGDEKVTAVGHASRVYMERLGMRVEVEKNIVVSTTTVDQLAVQCASGNLDAAIIWDSTAWQFRARLDVVAAGDAESGVGVPIGILSVTKNASLARAFIDFATAPEAAAVFENHGIVPATRGR